MGETTLVSRRSSAGSMGRERVWSFAVVFAAILTALGGLIGLALLANWVLGSGQG